MKLNDNLGSFTADMKLKAEFGEIGKFIEFKSWKPRSFVLLKGDQYKSQLKAYIKSGDFEQIFDAKKLAKEGIENPDNFTKTQILYLKKSLLMFIGKIKKNNEYKIVMIIDNGCNKDAVYTTQRISHK